MFLKTAALIPPCNKCEYHKECDGWCKEISGRWKHFKAVKKVLDNLKDPESNEYK